MLQKLLTERFQLAPAQGERRALTSPSHLQERLEDAARRSPTLREQKYSNNGLGHSSRAHVESVLALAASRFMRQPVIDPDGLDGILTCILD